MFLVIHHLVYYQTFKSVRSPFTMSKHSKQGHFTAIVWLYIIMFDIHYIGRHIDCELYDVTVYTLEYISFLVYLYVLYYIHTM